MLRNTHSSSSQSQQRMERAARLNELSQPLKHTTGKKVTRQVVKRLTDIDDPDIDHIAILGYD